MKNFFSLRDYQKKDIAQTHQRCQKKLKGFLKRLPELSWECQISILIPVCDESIKNLKRQILAFENQSLDCKKFELIYVINNQPSSTVKLRKIQQNNQQAINWLKKTKSRVIIGILDRSSVGLEIKNDNVGKARNFGLHAVTKRYLSQNRDGLIIQTDADTYPIDREYLKKIITTFTNKKIFGASGGLKMILDPETGNLKKRLFYIKNLQIFKNYFEWINLVTALHRKDLNPIMTPTRFSGAHMISRAVAAICAGGVPEVNRAEDTMFGKKLEKFSKSRGTEIFSGREKWFLQTTIRESSRTESSFEHIFENILKHNGRPLVKNPTGPIIHEFVKDMLLYLQKTKINQGNFSPFPNPVSLPSKQEFFELQKLKKKLGNKKSRDTLYKIYGDYRLSKKDSTLPNYFRKILQELYPPVPLTYTRLKKLKTLVYKDPKQKKYAKNAIKYFAQITLSK